MCLISGKQDIQCNHKKCWEHHNYPQYHTKTRAIHINGRIDFSSFKRVKQGRRIYVVPVNPYSPESAERSLFKKFEKLSHLEVFGDWPVDRDVFDRSEVGIEFVKYATFKNQYNSETESHDKKWYIDVKEAAVYHGNNL